ncbi:MULTISPECIES: AcvB/VirJ family lysyl-phosphatidylglycerol hydrolase [unclassified Sphingomonas]|uniref:AcvB/VirJ family lysyl-phosphatidylglycerol hydrolase n=1 Tax=unclassified Sphingomonas TaxID=196159 RepID=UPI0016106834|nr:MULTISPECIES: AcvB/VirJ family lysyl-phosphatidylglycerol hydrolase [unclassified Sphingomonas]MBB3349384.1 type IV secretory pathway VirJ component [Sphingomonas sp. BK069]MBB3475140.1 type IV secretory pathway VirJ component [Sphingomonas sp. BK345]
MTDFPVPPRRRNPLGAALALLAAGGLLVLGYLGELGYYNPSMYRLVPAATAPSPAQRGMVAVLFSGDSGFDAGMTPHIGRMLAAHGMPVLEINSLTAFREGRSPAEAAALVAEATHRALALPGAHRVLLVGQSFGADMLQYGASLLPLPLRARVPQLIFAVPGDTLLFRASPGGLFDGPPDRAALPSARRVDWAPVLCVHGATEANSLCPRWRQRNVRVVTLPGDHYLNHDPDRLCATLWQAIRQGG